MPFSIRPSHRFPVQCAVMYYAGPFLTLPLANFSGFESIKSIEGRAYTELSKTPRGYDAEKNREESKEREVSQRGVRRSTRSISMSRE